MSADEVFILRFWLEEAELREHLRWRAQIRSVNTRQRRITDDVDLAFALIAGATARGAVGRDRRERPLK